MIDRLLKKYLFNFLAAIMLFSGFSVTAQEIESWGITHPKASINIKEVLKTFQKNKEIVVAVIDTGIDASNPFLKNNIYVPSNKSVPFNRPVYGLDFSKDATDLYNPKDQHGHGTHIAGIIKNIYPDVKILPLKYYNPLASGEENLASTIQALRYAIEQKVDIINYSGGGPESSTEELQLMKLAQQRGILVVAASGNEESNIDQKENAYFPASYGLDNIITVTAHDQNNRILNSSNFGHKTVDISAPGERIKSTLPHGRFGFLTGTSQATAFVTGVAALLKSQYPHFTPQEIKSILKQSSYKVPSMKKLVGSRGILDAGQAFKLAMKKVQGQSGSIGPQRTVAQQGPGKIIYRLHN